MTRMVKEEEKKKMKQEKKRGEREKRNGLIQHMIIVDV
jgi:hypothetical protein